MLAPPIANQYALPGGAPGQGYGVPAGPPPEHLVHQLAQAIQQQRGVVLPAAAPVTDGGGSWPVTEPAAAAAAAVGSYVGGSSTKGASYDYWRDTPAAGMALGVLKTWGGAVYLKGLSKKKR